MASNEDNGGPAVDEAPVRAIDLLVAASLLTRLPVPLNAETAARRNAAAAWAYPLIGALVGALVALMLLGLLVAGAPAPLAALIAIATGALLTGALHEDGLADCADGIGGGWSRERRLEIMKDSSIGAYGTLALILATLARVSALAMLALHSGWAALSVIVIAGAASRAPLGAIMRWVPNARAGQGLSASVGRPPAASAVIALALALLVSVAPMGWQGLAAAVAAFLAAGVMAWLAWRKLGGQTGDVLGAAQVLAEIAALTAIFIAR